nr:hypothetical protein [uncultured Sphingobacterium sp.]
MQQDIITSRFWFLHAWIIGVLATRKYSHKYFHSDSLSGMFIDDQQQISFCPVIVK